MGEILLKKKKSLIDFLEGDFRRKVGSRWGTGQNVAERARREGDDVARGNDVSRGGGKAGEMEEIVEKEAASSTISLYGLSHPQPFLCMDELILSHFSVWTNSSSAISLYGRTHPQPFLCMDEHILSLFSVWTNTFSAFSLYGRTHSQPFLCMDELILIICGDVPSLSQSFVGMYPASANHLWGCTQPQPIICGDVPSLNHSTVKMYTTHLQPIICGDVPNLSQLFVGMYPTSANHLWGCT
ncbi:hypothetical protein RRG08_009772 [Elysia crispata]|uniref:Uncharacterized protein n=1 Tax=Elysia crispata TaxID=231223 RepID=A0AAE0ZQP6_9GAST|nr:hypothetical protein RRG08_009772 [Elysia crispata]